MRLKYCLLPSIALAVLFGQTQQQPVRSVPDPGVVTTYQTITPAGVSSVFLGRVYGLTFGADSKDVWVLGATRLYRMNWLDNQVVSSHSLGATPGPQSLVFDPASRKAFYAAASRNSAGTGSPSVQLFSEGEKLIPDLGDFLGGHPAIAAAPDAQGRRLAVLPLTFQNELAVVDLSTSKLVHRVKAGIAPIYAAIDRTGTVAWVTNWGGRLPKTGDLTAPTGLSPTADRVVVDARGLASTGTVTRVDLNTNASTHQLPVGLHPVALAWDEARHTLYVANNNRDSITVIDTATNRVVRDFPVQPFSRSVDGIAPTALALNADGSRLYVACGGINAVAIVEPRAGRILGMIPTAWYPTSLALSADGKYLGVGTLLGPGSGSQGDIKRRYVHSNRGSISVIPIPDASQLADYTNLVAANNRMDLPGVIRPALAASATPLPVPRRAGDPSLIQHVVYIIKENRTYDQLFGDLPRGNGDPSLVLFGADVTPNQRRLAQEFVTLDNFYATGGNSADGHQWLTQANEVAYCLWPGYAGRSYPFDGTDPIAYSQGGFIWEVAQKAGKTVRIYGEYAGRLSEIDRSQRLNLFKRWEQGDNFEKDWNIVAPIAPLNKILASYYPSYTNAIPDVVRARIFLNDLKKWEAAGTMPNMVLLQLPSDHTFGTTAGTTTPKAMVADNDLAVGQIVEGLSKSRFWPKMAIFIVEDDAQNGVDHVDGHRTVALAVSPYVRRQHVDSTFYSHQSMLKTMELMLGLPSLTLFDLIAADMRGSFTTEANLTPFTHEVPKQSLTELNPPPKALQGAARQGAIDSARMRWDVPDAVPSDKLNRILWHSIRGWSTRYPGVKKAVFTPMTLDNDEDDER